MTETCSIYGKSNAIVIAGSATLVCRFRKISTVSLTTSETCSVQCSLVDTYEILKLQYKKDYKMPVDGRNCCRQIIWWHFFTTTGQIEICNRTTERFGLYYWVIIKQVGTQRIFARDFVHNFIYLFNNSIPAIIGSIWCTIVHTL